MVTCEVKQQQKWAKCSCCGEMIHSFEKFFVVKKDGKEIRGERYCSNCEQYAYKNNPDIGKGKRSISPENRAERMREAYAAYDSKEAFWRDADDGVFG